MISAAFEAQKWPRRHEHLVEECVAAGRALHVGDVLPYLTGWHRHLIRSWNPRTHPWLSLVPRMAGPLRRWWFLCPRCERRCEALYVPPSARPEDWRCRACWNLIYASQRHGFRHPLRWVSTPRKKITQRNEVRRQQRLTARQSSSETREGVTAFVDDPELWSHDIERIEEFFVRRDPEGSALRARIAGETETSLAVIRELVATANSARVRKRAQKALAGYERRIGAKAPPGQGA